MNNSINISINKYNQNGDLYQSYGELQNVISENGDVTSFSTNELKFNIDTPVEIECKKSYDDTADLIITSDGISPKIINSRFAKLENNKFKVIQRNQSSQTNLYQRGNIDSQTNLFRHVNGIQKINLLDVCNTGELPVGNYVFYIRLGDDDVNKTPIVAESGNISIFIGDSSNIKNIRGGIAREKTNKSIRLLIENLDTSFSNIYLYYTIASCNEDGSKTTRAYEIIDPYKINSESETLLISGFENKTEIAIDDLNIQYLNIDSARTMTQVKNMLFLGNLKFSTNNISDLRKIANSIRVTILQGDAGWVDCNYRNVSLGEYYNEQNIYECVGYWPQEIYRLGVAFVMNNDLITPVYNLRGCKFNNVWDSNKVSDEDLPNNTILDEDNFDNTFGVFITPNAEIINYTKKRVNPLYFKIDVSKCEFEEYGIKGYIIVRQERIENTLFQGYSIGVNKYSGIPCIMKNGRGITNLLNGKVENNVSDMRALGLISVDVSVDQSKQSLLNGSKFALSKSISGNTESYNSDLYWHSGDNTQSSDIIQSELSYLKSGVNSKMIGDNFYSTMAGNAYDTNSFERLTTTDDLSKPVDDDWTSDLIRGVYTGFITSSEQLEPNCVYSIRKWDVNDAQAVKNNVLIAKNNNMPYYAISDRHSISDKCVNVYGGDCYSNTVTIRMNRNFIDPDTPTNDKVVNQAAVDKYAQWYSRLNEDENKYKTPNRGDLNAQKMGTWITFKCLSNNNLGLRSLDESHFDETALMGNPRGFYPVQPASKLAVYKLDESCLLNRGYSEQFSVIDRVGNKEVPFEKEAFDNRIAFSRAQREDAFMNSYRIFQALSYADIDKQYGAIVKLLPWNTNLICIFEHGIGIVPVNEKALLQTTTSQSIHLYGSGVLQEDVTLISGDYGSIWQESIIQTPYGIYGVDTYAKKIWRVNHNGQMEIISDMKLQRFLNDNIILEELDKQPILSVKNVKTHFNNYKGDIMFTFYNKDTHWNLCYNERQGKWITRYSWTPVYSASVNNIFYSLDQSQCKNIVLASKNNTNKIYIKDSIMSFNESGYFITDIVNADNYTIKNILFKFYISDFDGQEIILNAADDISDWGITISNNNGKITIKKDALVTKISQEAQKHFKWEEENQTYKIVPALTEILFIADNGYDDNIKIKNVLLNNYGPEKSNLEEVQSTIYLRAGIFVHGRAGVFDEINYQDDDPDNQIKPTYWYNKQEPFEFEFVVNGDVGLHKIFDNLVIVSNNVAPSEIEYEIIGDSYSLDKAKILNGEGGNSLLGGARLSKDLVTNKYSIIVPQVCRDMKSAGRRLGNIQYKEDSWYTTIMPLRYKKNGSEEKTTKLRDKYIKIRVKYTGDDLVIITALRTLLTLSYS